jgi:Helix-turn-helix domain
LVFPVPVSNKAVCLRKYAPGLFRAHFLSAEEVSPAFPGRGIYGLAMSPADSFSALLAGIRASGLSNTEIAERCGLTQATLWRLETGYARQPTLDSYIRLCRTYQQVTHQPPLNLGRR